MSDEQEKPPADSPVEQPGWWTRTGRAGSTPDAGPWAAPGAAPGTEPLRWELPTDSIGGRRSWMSARLAVPFVFGLVIITALLAGGLGAAIGITSERSSNDPSGPLVFASPSPAASVRIVRRPDSLAGIAARVLPSVVEVDVSAGDAKDTGSGFVIATQGTSAYILTNNHVISLAATQHGKVRVVLQNGASLAALIRGRAPHYDLAVLRVDHVSGLKPASLGDSNAIAVGDPVIAIGSPLGLAGTVTAGIVSAVHRAVVANGEGTDTNAVIDAIQTDAPINPGNSGGPLVDGSGRVIGVNSAIATLSSGSGNPFDGQTQSGSIGLGFAIPVDSARDTAVQIISRGFAIRPVIGVSLDVQYHGPPQGALIGCPSTVTSCVAVQSNGPAAKAGLREGDVITAVDGVSTPGPDEVILLTRQHKPGDKIRITVIRGGSHRTFTFTLGQARA